MTTAKTERKLEIGGHEKNAVASGKEMKNVACSVYAYVYAMGRRTIYYSKQTCQIQNTNYHVVWAPVRLYVCERERERYAMRNLTPTHLAVSSSSRGIHFFLVMICGSNRSSAVFVFVPSAHLLTYWESVTIIADVSSDR